MSDSQTRQVRKTIAMLSSMIQSGESHSPESEKMVELSNKAMDGIEERLDCKDSDYVIMPRRLTAENGAKAALSYEFFEEFGIEHSLHQKVPVSWTTIKDIYKKAVEVVGK